MHAFPDNPFHMFLWTFFVYFFMQYILTMISPFLQILPDPPCSLVT